MLTNHTHGAGGLSFPCQLGESHMEGHVTFSGWSRVFTIKHSRPLCCSVHLTKQTKVCQFALWYFSPEARKRGARRLGMWRFAGVLSWVACLAVHGSSPQVGRLRGTKTQAAQSREGRGRKCPIIISSRLRAQTRRAWRASRAARGRGAGKPARRRT